MANRHVMTAKRRAALRKAQLASARKRRGARRSDLKTAARKRRTDSARSHTRRGAYKRYDKQVAAIYQKHGKSARSAKAHATARKYGRRAIKTYAIAAVYNPRLAHAMVKGTVKAPVGAAKAGHSFSKGFAKGYATSRQTQRVRKQNLSRMGGTTIHRVSVPALPGGGHKPRGGRRVRGY